MDIDRRIRGGEPIEHVARSVGMDDMTLRRLLQRRGLTYRTPPSGSPMPPGAAAAWSLQRAGYSVRHIADLLGVAHDTAAGHLGKARRGLGIKGEVVRFRRRDA